MGHGHPRATRQGGRSGCGTWFDGNWDGARPHPSVLEGRAFSADRKQNKRGQACKPNSVPAEAGGDHSSSPGIAAGVKRPTRESPLRAGSVRPLEGLRGGPPLLSYLVLLRVGFAVPRALLPARCALTLSPLARAAPFHPCPPLDPDKRESNGRCVFCGTFRIGGVRPPKRHPPLTLAVSEHTALRSSDFPLPRPCQPR